MSIKRCFCGEPLREITYYPPAGMAGGSVTRLACLACGHNGSAYHYAGCPTCAGSLFVVGWPVDCLTCSTCGEQLTTDDIERPACVYCTQLHDNPAPAVTSCDSCGAHICRDCLIPVARSEYSGRQWGRFGLLPLQTEGQLCACCYESSQRGPMVI